MAIIEDTVTDGTGQPVLVRIEVADTSAEDSAYGRKTRESVVGRAKNTFKEAMQLVHTCTTQIATTIQNVPQEQRPKEFEVQFAVKIDGKVGACIAESTVGAQLQVTLRWGEKEQK